MYRIPTTDIIEDSDSLFKMRLNINSNVKSLTITCHNGRRPSLTILFDIPGNLTRFRTKLEEQESNTPAFYSYLLFSHPSREPIIIIEQYYKFVPSILEAMKLLPESTVHASTVRFLKMFPWKTHVTPKVFKNAHICQLIAEDLAEKQPLSLRKTCLDSQIPNTPRSRNHFFGLRPPCAHSVSTQRTIEATATNGPLSTSHDENSDTDAIKSRVE